MSAQVIVQISKGWGNQTLIELVRAPNVPIDDIGITPFQVDPTQLPAWTQPDAVRDHGQKLLSGLLQSHDRVRDALQHVLGLKQGDRCPIYVQLKALPAAETFCWEALCDAHGNFLALDRRWQVGRIALSPQLTSRGAVEFEPPLRIVAVLSALARDAKPEWDGLYAAVRAVTKAGLAVELHVATGHEALQDEIFGLQDPVVSLFSLTSGIDLLTKIDEVAPHIVHFFCHGSTAFAQPRLELATLNDTDHSSIELNLQDLAGSPGVRESWLVVLNCCEGGAATRDIHSLSYALVAGGANAAVGMKEAVDQLDAHEFSGKLYPSLLKNVRTAVGTLAPGQETALDWADALWEPRRALQARYVGQNAARQWTLPVLYAQADPLRVRRAPAQSRNLRAHDRTIEEALALLPEDKRAVFLAELELLRKGS